MGMGDAIIIALSAVVGAWALIELFKESDMKKVKRIIREHNEKHQKTRCRRHEWVKAYNFPKLIICQNCHKLEHVHFNDMRGE